MKSFVSRLREMTQGPFGLVVLVVQAVVLSIVLIGGMLLGGFFGLSAEVGFFSAAVGVVLLGAQMMHLAWTKKPHWFMFHPSNF